MRRETGEPVNEMPDGGSAATPAKRERRPRVVKRAKEEMAQDPQTEAISTELAETPEERAFFMRQEEPADMPKEESPKEEIPEPPKRRKAETLADVESAKARAKRRREQESSDFERQTILAETRKKIREDRKKEESTNPDVRWARLQARFPLAAGVFQKLANEYATNQYQEEIVSLIAQRTDELKKRIAHRAEQIRALEARKPKLLSWIDRNLFRITDPELDGLKKIHAADVDLLADAEREGKKFGISF